MDPEHVPILVNVGLGGVMLWLYVRLFAQVVELLAQLREVREQQWQLLITLIGEEAAQALSKRRAPPR